MGSGQQCCSLTGLPLKRYQRAVAVVLPSTLTSSDLFGQGSFILKSVRWIAKGVYNDDEWYLDEATQDRLPWHFGYAHAEGKPSFRVAKDKYEWRNDHHTLLFYEDAWNKAVALNLSERSRGYPHYLECRAREDERLAKDLGMTVSALLYDLETCKREPLVPYALQHEFFNVYEFARHALIPMIAHSELYQNDIEEQAIRQATAMRLETLDRVKQEAYAEHVEGDTHPQPFADFTLS